MKCSKEVKRFLKKHGKDKYISDDPFLLKMFTCKNWFKRIKKPTKFDLQD